MRAKIFTIFVVFAACQLETSVAAKLESSPQNQILIDVKSGQWIHGILARETATCPIWMEERILASVTLWARTNPKSYEGAHCWGEKVKMTLGGGFPRIQRKVEQIPVSVEQCKEMAANTDTYTEKPFRSLESDFFSDTPIELENDNYYRDFITLPVDNWFGKITTPKNNLVQPCDFSAGFCNTTDSGVIVWSIPEQILDEVEMKPINEAYCTVSSDMIWCDKSEFVVLSKEFAEKNSCFQKLNDVKVHVENDEEKMENTTPVKFNPEEKIELEEDFSIFWNIMKNTQKGVIHVVDIVEPISGASANTINQ